MKFKDFINEETRLHTYNLELDKPRNGVKFVFRSFREKLKKNEHYKGTLFDGSDMVGFTVYREIKPNDLTIEDYDIIRVSMEGSDRLDHIRIVRKTNRAVDTGKLVPLTRAEAETILEWLAYDDDIFKDRTDEEKEVARKINKLYKFGFGCV